MLVLMLCFFFFFQAEDGIRDIGVTGVQTCALPICSHGRPGRLLHGSGDQRRDHVPPLGWTPARGDVETDRLPVRDVVADRGRSEERRVGKEWRSRWSPYH